MTVTSKSYIAELANGGGAGSCPRPSSYPGGTCGGCSSLLTQTDLYPAFAGSTNAAYREDPLKNTGPNNYRLAATATITWECDAGAVTNARLQSRTSGGGQEAPRFYGRAHYSDVPSSGPTGGTSVPLPNGRYDYLLWGYPDPDLEVTFQGLAERSNASIFHKVQSYMGCDPNNQGRIGVTMAGTPFPSHRIWVDASETTANAANPVGNHGPKQIDQGKLELLWYLPPVPATTVLPSNVYPFVSFYPELNASADPKVVEISSAVQAPAIPPAACTPQVPPAPPADPPACADAIHAPCSADLVRCMQNGFDQSDAACLLSGPSYATYMACAIGTTEYLRRCGL